MLDPKMSDACYVQLANESKKTNDYQVNYLIYLNTLKKIKNKIEVIDKMIYQKKLEIENKKKENNNFYINCSIAYNDNFCANECNKIYNPNKNLVVTGRTENCNNFLPENFDILPSTIGDINSQILNNNKELINLKKKCECRVPKYQEVETLIKELEYLKLEKEKLEADYSSEKPPSIPLLNTACCNNEMSCKEGNCNSLLDDCEIKETFISDKTNNDFFSFQNVSSIILLIILLFVFLQRK